MAENMRVVGIDLSGPANPDDTAVVAFKSAGEALQRSNYHLGANDRDIVETVQRLSAVSDLVVGIDAPLSYNVGGGDRPADSELRRSVTEAGLPAGSVMAPTAPRMVYLTLRGMGLSRAIDACGTGRVRIVEVHPGASLALRGAPLEAVLALKSDPATRSKLLEWLEEHGLNGVVDMAEPSDHYVAACSAALAAWKWATDEPVWIARGDPPHHPYDFAC